MLIAFSGLPGTGKTSISRELAKRLHATYLRIDTIEQAIVSCGNIEPIMEEGYETAYRVAAENLNMGLTDRGQFGECPRYDAGSLGGGRARVPTSDWSMSRSSAPTKRNTGAASRHGHPILLVSSVPTWEKVKSREYHLGHSPRIVIDTAGRSVSACVDELMSALATAAVASHHCHPGQRAARAGTHAIPQRRRMRRSRLCAAARLGRDDV